MATVISSGAGVIEPQIVLNITSDQTSGNIVHPILGRANPDVTIRPAGLRTGSIEMGFAGDTAEADSEAARSLHATGGVFVVTSDDRSTLEMFYIVSGRIVRELEDGSRDAWIVRVDYQEVTQ